MGNYKNLLDTEHIILSSIRELLKESYSKEETIDESTTLRETNTPEFKEGLVVYFSALPSNKLKLV